jgi:protein-disulfide isomerase
MKGRFALLLLTSLIVLTWSVCIQAQDDWQVRRSFNLEGATPLDVELSARGKWIFVLTDKGEILVYAPNGTLKDTISVGKHIDGIEPGPVEDVLVIKSTEKKTLELITVDLVQSINISDSPVRGPAEAPVALAVYTDFQAPACVKLAPVLDELLAKYPGQVKLVYKNFPLKSKHKFAGRAAVAALAAERQGKFWEFYDLLFANYKGLNQEKVEELAGSLGMDVGQLKKDMRDSRLLAKIQLDMSEGAVAGVRTPPTVFVNGRMVRNPTLEGFEEAIERELKKKNKLTAHSSQGSR